MKLQYLICEVGKGNTAPEMIVDLGEEEDAVTDSALVSPALKPGEGGVCPHLLTPTPTSERLLRAHHGARVLLHINNA